MDNLINRIIKQIKNAKKRIKKVKRKRIKLYCLLVINLFFKKPVNKSDLNDSNLSDINFDDKFISQSVRRTIQKKITLVGFDNTHPIIIPSNKPTNFHSSGRKPTAPMQRTVNSPNIYKPGIGAASMPGGGPAGNGNNPENNLANEFGKKKQLKSKENNINHDNYYNEPNKKKEDECPLDDPDDTDDTNSLQRKGSNIKLISIIRKHKNLIKEAEIAGQDPTVQRDLNNMIYKLSYGYEGKSIGIGRRRVQELRNVMEIRSSNGARLFITKKGNEIKIVGKSSKNNQKKVIKILKKLGY